MNRTISTYYHNNYL